jgi:hypothetical protein
MADAITIKLIHEGDGVSADNTILSDVVTPVMTDDSVDNTMSLPNVPGMSLIGKIATTAALAKTGYELARASFTRIRNIERDNQQRTETLRNYGGAGFSANTIGDRFSIFGQRIPGNTSTAYRK